MRPLKRKISITIDSDVYEKIDKLSEWDGRSISQYINIVLKRFIQTEIEHQKEKV